MEISRKGKCYNVNKDIYSSEKNFSRSVSGDQKRCLKNSYYWERCTKDKYSLFLWSSTSYLIYAYFSQPLHSHRSRRICWAYSWADTRVFVCFCGGIFSVVSSEFLRARKLPSCCWRTSENPTRRTGSYLYGRNGNTLLWRTFRYW